MAGRKRKWVMCFSVVPGLGELMRDSLPLSLLVRGAIQEICFY